MQKFADKSFIHASALGHLEKHDDIKLNQTKTFLNGMFSLPCATTDTGDVKFSLR